jgi:hypothetical protein
MVTGKFTYIRRARGGPSIYEAMLLQGFRPDYVLKGTLSDQIRLGLRCSATSSGEGVGGKRHETLARGARRAGRGRGQAGGAREAQQEAARENGKEGWTPRKKK